MHYYTFNPAKFNHEIKHLDDMQELVYRRLIDEYMTREKPLTTNFEKLAWRMRCKTDEMKKALQVVLDEFFVIKKLKGDNEPCHHHARMDKEIKRYKSKNGKGTNEVQETTNETTSKNTNKNSTDIKKDKLIKILKKQGIKANTRMRIGELQALFDEHCKQDANELQESANEVQTTTNPVLEVYNQEPVTNNHVSVTHAPVENLSEESHGESQTNKPTVSETFEFLKNSCVIPAFGDYQVDDSELGFLIAETHAHWCEKMSHGQPFTKTQILGKILKQVKKIGSTQDILERLTVAPVAEAPVAEEQQPQQYRTLSNFEILAMKRQAKQGGQ